MKIIHQIIFSLLLIYHAQLHADEATPSAEAFNAFSKFTSLLNREIEDMAKSGTLLGPGEATISDATKLCNALISAAKDRKDIIESAQLTLQAYSYVVNNWSLAKENRKKSNNAILDNLLEFNKAGPTDGKMMKCYQISMIRLSMHFGKPSITEKEVLNIEDVDYSSIIIQKSTPEPITNVKTPPVEITVQVSVEGSLQLNGKAITKNDLSKTLIDLKKESESDGKLILLTISPDRRSKYERVIEVIDAASQAGVTNVTFQEMVEQAAPRNR